MSENPFQSELATFLASDHSSDGAKNAVEHILQSNFNDVGIRLTDADIVKTSYSALKVSLIKDYFDGIERCIDSVIENDCLGNEPLEKELAEVRRATEANENFDAETKKIADDIIKLEAGSQEYSALVRRFTEEMNKAIDHGRICDPERMIALYPIFREINIEQEEIQELEASEQVECENAQDQTPATKPVSMADFDAVEHLDIMSLGGVLALVLDNPKLPVVVHNAICRALNDIYNNLPKDDDVEEIDGFKDFSMTYNQLLFGKYEKTSNAEKPDVLDLSAHPESVQRLNKQQTEKLIKKHKLPDEVSNILRSCAEVKQ